jgi:hypothetical protein
VHQLLAIDFAENEATRDDRTIDLPWYAPYAAINGQDAKATMESTLLFQAGQTGTWKNWDLSALAQKWVNGTVANYGVILWATNEDTDGKDLRFRSSEYSNSTFWPKLEIIYSLQAKTVYFLKDHLGSIRATVQDTTGAPVRGYDDYDPWGYILAGRSMASSILPLTRSVHRQGRDDEYGVTVTSGEVL